MKQKASRQGAKGPCESPCEQFVMMPQFIKDLFGGDKPEAGDNPFETFINMVQGKTEKKAEEAKAAEAPASEGEPADEPAAAE